MAGTLVMPLATAGPAKAARKPSIEALSAYPTTIGSGGTTGISASVTGAGSCTLSATKSKPVSGLPESFPCGEGGAMRVLAMPANKGKQAVAYTLNLTAQAAGGKAKAKAKVTISVLPEEAGLADKGLLALGYSTTCTVLAQEPERGHVRCWGSNGDGDLGNEGSTPYSLTPVSVVNITNAVQVAAGVGHTCALLATGHIKCWGASIGLGNGSYAGHEGESIPVAVVNIADAVQITAGNTDTCALLATGHVDCWGLNTAGQLGRLTIGPAEFFTPVEIPKLENATEVAAGAAHTCALLKGGTIDCWGGDNVGQLGDGAFGGGETNIPVPIPEVKGASEVTSGEAHSCAIFHEEGHPTGQIKCWGWDRWGQLGDDNVGEARKPENAEEEQLLPISGAVQVSAATAHTCALLKAETVECWGSDARGQLGDGQPKEEQHVAVPVGGHLEHVIEIDASQLHTCALLEGGAIRCWGSDTQGELGNGTAPQLFFSEPVAVVGFPLPKAARRNVARHKARHHRRHR
jgi:alpha-tubulin suppressor-like RCC1 family protein